MRQFAQRLGTTIVGKSRVVVGIGEGGILLDDFVAYRYALVIFPQVQQRRALGKQKCLMGAVHAQGDGRKLIYAVPVGQFSIIADQTGKEERKQRIMGKSVVECRNIADDVVLKLIGLGQILKCEIDELLENKGHNATCGTEQCMCPKAQNGPGDPSLLNHEWCSSKAQINGTLAHITAIFGFMLAGLVVQDAIKLS